MIITDISMPGINGIAVARRLRALVPETRVLFLSVHNEPGDRERQALRALILPGEDAVASKIVVTPNSCKLE